MCDRVVDVGAFAEDGTAFRAWCVSATTRLSESCGSRVGQPPVCEKKKSIKRSHL